MEMIKHLDWKMPTLSSYHYSAAAEIALSTNKTGRNQLFNKCIGLSCDTKFLDGYTGYIVCINNSSLRIVGNISFNELSLKYALDNCDDTIQRMINDGLFVYFAGIDDYFVPGKSLYQQRHRSHDGLICGYDNSNSTYDMIAYNTEWVFSEFKVKKDVFIQSMREGVAQGFNSYITGIKAIDREVNLDPFGIKEKISDYLNSEGKYPLNYRGIVKGQVVYDYFVMYINKILNGSIPHERIDWRPMRVIWEYQSLMYERINKVEDCGFSYSCISKDYKSLVDEFNKLRLLYAICSKKPKTNFLLSIKDKLNEFKNKENQLLSEFIRRFKI